MLPHIVIDTNCLLQIISRRSQYYVARNKFINGEYMLCVTNEILQEYEELLSVRTSSHIAKMIIEIILKSPHTMKLEAHYRWGLIQADWDDNKFVDCAIVANADYIVSEDGHFKALASIPFPHVNVIRLDDFIQRLTV